MKMTEPADAKARRPRSLPAWSDATDTPLLTMRGASRLSTQGRSSLYELIRRNEIKAVKIGRSIRIVRSSLEEWIARQIAEV